MINFSLKSDFATVKTRIKAERDAMKSWKQPLGEMVAQIYRGVMQNFKEEGTGKKSWKRLSAATLYQKAHRKSRRSNNPSILQDTGMLRNSIMPEITETEGIVSTNIKYARVHQFGIGRVPARPFLIIRDDVKPKILEIAHRWLAAKGTI